MSDIDHLESYFQELPASARFTQRAANIPGDFRAAWRLSMLCLLVSHGRADSLSTEHLHVLWWAARSEHSRDLVLRWLEGTRRPDELLVRFDPSLAATVDLGLGLGIVARNSSTGVVRLTGEGKALLASVLSEKNVLEAEKAFLDKLPRRITQAQIRELLEWS